MLEDIALIRLNFVAGRYDEDIARQDIQRAAAAETTRTVHL